MNKVLLTGATGFVGRQCIPELLARGYEVHGLSRSERPANAPSVHWHHCDLLDPQATSELVERISPTHLIHCAWYALPGKYWEAPENYQWLEASLHLFRTFADFGGRRVVGVGSCAEYDWRYGRCVESKTPLNPATTYGLCKRRAYDALLKLHDHNGLSAAWARLFFLYGPHERPERFVPSVINSLLRGEIAQCSEGGQLRDYIYTKDAGAVLVALLDSSVTGAVNAASGAAVTIRQIAVKIGEQLGRDDLLRFGERKSEEAQEISADTARLTNEVGWSPRFTLHEGLSETISWWRRHQADASYAS